MAPQHNRTVLVLLDTPLTELSSSALELLTVARELGRVEAVSIGSPSVATLAQLGSYGVELVRQAKGGGSLGAEAAATSTPLVAEVLARAVEVSDADVVLLTATFPNKESAARLAWLTGAGLIVDAASVTTSDDGHVVGGKRVFAGSWDTVCEVVTDKAVVTVRANAVVAAPADAPVEVDVEGFDVSPSALALASVPTSREVHVVAGASGRPALAEAAVVVAGGRGTFGDFTPVEDLADALGAAVGATRDCVDEGWIGHDAQIGQTGVTVAPRLYVGAGISGAPHHRGGMQASQVIVAVNADPECPIFEISDFAVVGDLAEVLPQAAARIREHQGR
ncbi:electron transfer flavoprotein subunit alpha/FixB family protein [Luteimicrobium subarcticum]|uniref:Electron transfer flavoprotein alpha subunit apoprotein n=1 Tax=Luteimicrobium subarcticum TaxID=620910 RepID=A0A2M8W1D9_9MICO|nr:electron transfer flavoprotein subunit alpha/FixB family protein [Luteimicrobium subarcticum]PJI84743.1 electron transfer flavoprotein alpha subunit apoprotein [Luteimicrobium subarcticum]